MLISRALLSCLIFTFIFTSGYAQAEKKLQSGSWSVNQSIQGYSLDNNNGERSATIEIKFSKSFKSKPEIILSVTQLDASKDFNSRFNVETISVSRDGFTLKVKTWADSRIFSISGYWIAIGE